jgi:hypothetical protein
VDLDGGADIYRAHGWRYPWARDPIFESGLQNVLRFCDGNGIRATLFVIASSLDDPRKRELIQFAAREGHEIASHTVTHPNLRQIDAATKQTEVCRSREMLEHYTGNRVTGFRAPGYSIDRETVDLLWRYGYEYDSSSFPTPAFAARLEVPQDSLRAPGRLFPDNGLLELPLPDYRPGLVPFSPSYSLLLGGRYFRWGVRKSYRRAVPLVLLLHLLDLAEPLTAQYCQSWKARVFTLSMLSAQEKMAKCQAMLDFVRRHYRVTTTRKLIDGWADGNRSTGSANDALANQ